MKAEHVHNFTRGGDPYKKMKIGKWSDPSGLVDAVVNDIFFLWDEYFDDRKGIEQSIVGAFTGDDGKRTWKSMHLDGNLLNGLGGKRQVFIDRLNAILEESGIEYETKLYEYFEIKIYYMWR